MMPSPTFRTDQLVGLRRGGPSKKSSCGKSRPTNYNCSTGRHPSHKWSTANNIVRLFGVGALDLFATFPASDDAAITGSVGVALFDMYMHKKKASFFPNDVDIFIAVPLDERALPLAKAYPIITKWIHDSQAKGFHYSLTKGGSVYGNKMCIYDFVCQNEQVHPKLRHPKVSFIIKCASSVREICNEFDLPICGPILLRNKMGRYHLDVTTEMIYMFHNHKTTCRYQVLDPRMLTRMIKYHKRGFTIFQPDYILSKHERLRGDFPTVEYYWPRSVKPVPAWFIEDLLGRLPTEEEAGLYNIDLYQDVRPDDGSTPPPSFTSDQNNQFN